MGRYTRIALELAATGMSAAGLALLGGGAVVGGTILARRRKKILPLDEE